MKLKYTLFILLTSMFVTNLYAGKYGKYVSTEKINTHYQFETKALDNTLYIHNINGSVKVQGYEGNEIIVDIEKSISANTQTNLELGQKEAWFKVVNQGGDIHMFMKTPYSYLKTENGVTTHHEKNNHQKYNYKMDYSVKVPRNTNLHVQTVNDGNISIADIQAMQIYAKNINGKVKLQKVAGEMDIHTINGNIALSYLNKNIKNSRFKSINGNIDVQFVEQPNIDVTFKTLNGKFYTSYDATRQSSFIKKEVQKFEKGIKYKLKPQNQIQIGSGEFSFYFKTINGDISITNKV